MGWSGAGGMGRLHVIWLEKSFLGQSLYRRELGRFRIYHDPPQSFASGSAVKNLSASAGDVSSISGLERSPGEGNGQPPQYSCLKYPMNRGAWRATVHRAAKSQTQLSRHALQYLQPANQPQVAAFGSCYSQALLLLTQ